MSATATKNEENIFKLIIDFRKWTRDWSKYNDEFPTPEQADDFVKKLSEKYKVTIT